MVAGGGGQRKREEGREGGWVEKRGGEADFQ